MSVLYLKAVDATFPQVRRDHEEQTRAALADMFTEHRRRVLSRFRNGILNLFDAEWEESVQATIFDRNRATARDFASRTIDALVGKQGFDLDVMDPWLRENARIAGERITDTVEADVADAMVDGSEGIGDVFDQLLTAGVAMYAVSMVTTAANFGANDAARATARMKTWRVNSSNPRASHAALDGETVPIADNFSNGMPWPGWVGGGADEIAGCQCSVIFDV